MRVKHPVWLFGIGGVILAFSILNAYLFWLSTMIIPFESPLNLTVAGRDYEFPINRFYTARYVCLVEFKIPKSSESNWMNQSGELVTIVDRVRRDLAVDISISLKDGQGTEVLGHRGSLDDWTFTNGHKSSNADAALYKYWFDAHLFESYLLNIKVIRGNDNTKTYEPRILFHGIDDGYFSFVSVFYNILLTVVIILIGVVICVSRFVRKSARERLAKPAA